MMKILVDSLLLAVPWCFALVIAARCFMVVYHLNLRTWGGHWLQFYGFGLAYGILMVAALGAAAHITEGNGTVGDWLFLAASAGMILFDRRARPADKAAA